MSLELKKAEKSTYPQVKALFLEAFPPEERPPFRRLCSRAERGKADFWTLYDGALFVGMAYVLRHRDTAYLFFLAIEASQRGKGYGTQTLEALKKKYADSRLFLALEMLEPKADNYEQRVKRHGFYERCGFRDLPYKLREVGVVYDTMGIGGPVQPEEYKAMIDAWLGWPLKHILDMRMTE